MIATGNVRTAGNRRKAVVVRITIQAPYYEFII